MMVAIAARLQIEGDCPAGHFQIGLLQGRYQQSRIRAPGLSSGVGRNQEHNKHQDV